MTETGVNEVVQTAKVRLRPRRRGLNSGVHPQAQRDLRRTWGRSEGRKAFPGRREDGRGIGRNVEHCACREVEFTERRLPSGRREIHKIHNNVMRHYDQFSEPKTRPPGRRWRPALILPDSPSAVKDRVMHESLLDDARHVPLALGTTLR